MQRKQEYIEYFIEALVGERNLSINTVDAYRRDLGHFIEFINPSVVAQVNRNKINEYITHLSYVGFKKQFYRQKNIGIKTVL